MGSLDILNVRKLKSGLYEVADAQGRSATGVTEQMARNQWYMLYKHKIPTGEMDMSKFINNFPK